MPKIQINQNIDLLYLKANLARIDLLIQRAVRRWQCAGQDPLDMFRGLYLSNIQAEALITKPFCHNWGDTVNLEANEEAWFDQKFIEIEAYKNQIQNEASNNNIDLRLNHLTKEFGLDDFEIGALLICLAPALDLRYEKLYGYLQDDISRKNPGVGLIIDLLSPSGIEHLKKLAYFNENAPLFNNHLLRKMDYPNCENLSLLSQLLYVDPTVVSWLSGNYPSCQDPDVNFVMAANSNHEIGNLSQETKLLLERVKDDNSILVLFGPNQVEKDSAANFVAHHKNRLILEIDLSCRENENNHFADQIKLGIRDARMIDAIPHIKSFEVCEVNGEIPLQIQKNIIQSPCPIIISSHTNCLINGIARERRLFSIPFPVPNYQERRNVWLHYSSAFEIEELMDFSALAGQFSLTTSQIRDAVSSAIDLAGMRGEKPTNTDFFAAARANSNIKLSSLAIKLKPCFSWEDIVLPADQLSLLHEIVATVRSRSQVLESWGVGIKLASNNGITVLFAGQPGTGKTMAAGIIAVELKMDIYKIDLSTIVSKYIGETEKNLERIFQEAEASNAILFFDEADALFGKRSEVRDSHDRYANIEISYLLQRMEAYDGITILATNLRSNLDEAFTRRLQFAVDFPFPEDNDRLRIWRTLFPPNVPCQPDINYEFLARRFRLAGGNIRNIIINAAYLAASDGGMVTMSHILHSARRELQKMGRLVSEPDLFSGENFE